MSEDDFLWPPESFEQNDDPALAQKLQHTVDIIFAQLRRLQSSAGTTAHDILSATHEDTTIAAAVNGDLIRRAAGAWARLPIGTDGQAVIGVAGLPEWSNDGTALTIDPTKGPHALLSATHSDTVAASPVLGDMVVAQGVSPADLDVYWIDGLPFDAIADVLDVGGEDYWIDGLPVSGLESANEVAWTRKPNSTTAGYVWTSGATGPDWQPSASGGDFAQVSRASDFSLPASTQTTVQLDTVVSDAAGFWSAGTPSRLTVPAGKSGKYVLNVQATIETTFVGNFWLAVYKNGANVAENVLTAGAGVATRGPLQTTYLANLVAGDYLELSVYMESPAAAKLVKGGAALTFVQLLRVA